jgi:hypothetical protein
MERISSKLIVSCCRLRGESSNPDTSRAQLREALLMLGRVALNRKLPPPDVLSGWESAQWIYESVDGELRQEAAAAVAELPAEELKAALAAMGKG